MKSNISKSTPINKYSLRLQNENIIRLNGFVFGELGWIVYNTKTGNFIGDNRWVLKFREINSETDIVIIEKGINNKLGLVNFGYYKYKGEIYPFSVVNWKRKNEKIFTSMIGINTERRNRSTYKKAERKKSFKSFNESKK